MNILFRRKSEGKGKGKWMKVKEQKFQSEAALQNILYESPEIIPIEKLGGDLLKPRLFIKEAGLPGSGNTDLIGIDENGGITIIECKLATNADIRRKVIGQVLEYAAHLWHMGYDEFDKICCRVEKWGDRSLEDAMSEKMVDALQGWSKEDFKDSVASTLERGDFHLIIAVDALNDELKRIIEFLNSRGENSPKIHALEMRQFETPEFQVLVPELFGFVSDTGTEEKVITEQKFLSTSSEVAARLYHRLKELAKGKEFRNSGFTRRGYSFRHEHGTLFVLYPTRMEMWIGQDHSDAYLNSQAVGSFYSKLFEIEAFEKRKDLKTPAAAVNDETWKPHDVDTFVSAVELLASHLRSR